MSESQSAATAQVEVLQQRVTGLFVELCGDPDNAAAATAVDQALHDLDALLAATTG
ncbi:hypothetical protein [Streptomyces sp. NPDC059008]|uniref:hypothetical protein n=1 Tax=Streptomyces sp. NPDC059008 TaxID=3346693 RepID=UPI0036A1F1BE